MDPNLLLKREEIKIFRGNGFKLPIHPKLLHPSIRLDSDLAFKVLEQSATDWVEDLNAKIREQTFEEQEFWRNIYLITPRKIIRKFGRIHLEPEIFLEINFLTNENGFARVLSLSRNQGCLYFEKNPEIGYIGFGRMCNIPTEKLRLYAIKIWNENTFTIYTYSQHNVDQLAPSLFLRAWGVNYLNAALESVM